MSIKNLEFSGKNDFNLNVDNINISDTATMSNLNVLNSITLPPIETNLKKIADNDISYNSGVNDDGVQRITISTDDSINTKLDNIITNTNTISSINTKLDTTNSNTSSTNTKLDINNTNLNTLITNTGTTNNKLDTNDTNLNSIITNTNNANEKLDNLNVNVRNNKNEVIFSEFWTNPSSDLASVPPSNETYCGWNVGASDLFTISKDINIGDSALCFEFTFEFKNAFNADPNLVVSLELNNTDNGNNLLNQYQFRAEGMILKCQTVQTRSGISSTVDTYTIDQPNFTHDTVDGVNFLPDLRLLSIKRRIRIIVIKGFIFYQFYTHCRGYRTFNIITQDNLSDPKLSFNGNSVQIRFINEGLADWIVESFQLYKTSNLYIDALDFNLPYNQIFLSDYLSNGVNYEINGNYSATPTSFIFTSPSNRVSFIKRLILKIEDASIDPADFGGIPGGITNGMTLSFKRTSGASETFIGGTDVIPLRKNSDISGLCYDFNLIAGTGDDVGVFRYSPFLGSRPIIIMPTGTIQANFNDNLTGLSSFRIQIQGFQVRI